MFIAIAGSVGACVGFSAVWEQRKLIFPDWPPRSGLFIGSRLHLSQHTRKNRWLMPAIFELLQVLVMVYPAPVL